MRPNIANLAILFACIALLGCESKKDDAANENTTAEAAKSDAPDEAKPGGDDHGHEHADGDHDHPEGDADGKKDDAADHKHDAPVVTKAVAVLHPTEGNKVAGTVWFEATPDGTKITANLTGLTPGDHGFHIHQWGDCSGADGKTAGGHFNPDGHDHAGPDGDKRHVGDLGNLTANEGGEATYERVDKHLVFAGGHSILGRGIIVHADKDDLTSQPTGAAGARVACGAIGIAKGAE